MNHNLGKTYYIGNKKEVKNIGPKIKLLSKSDKYHVIKIPKIKSPPNICPEWIGLFLSLSKIAYVITNENYIFISFFFIIYLDKLINNT